MWDAGIGGQGAVCAAIHRDVVGSIGKVRGKPFASAKGALRKVTLETSIMRFAISKLYKNQCR